MPYDLTSTLSRSGFIGDTPIAAPQKKKKSSNYKIIATRRAQNKAARVSRRINRSR